MHTVFSSKSAKIKYTNIKEYKISTYTKLYGQVSDLTILDPFLPIFPHITPELRRSLGQVIGVSEHADQHFLHCQNQSVSVQLMENTKPV